MRSTNAHLPKETSVYVAPPQASYVAIDVGTGVPYDGDGRMGDTRGAGREATQGSKHGFSRGDMAKAKKQHTDGSRKSR